MQESALILENQRLRQKIEKLKREQNILLEGAAEFRSFEEKCAEQKKKNEKLQKEIDQLFNIYNQLEADRKNLEDGKESQKKKLAAAKEQLTQAEKNMELMTRQAEEATEKLLLIKNSLTETEMETERLRNAHTDAMRAQQELIEYREKLGMKDQEIADTKAILKEAETTLEREKTILEKKDREIAEVRVAQEKREREIEEAKADLKERETELKTLEEGVTAAKSRMDEAKKKRDKLDGEYDKCMVEIRERLRKYFEKRDIIDEQLKDIEESLQIVVKAAEDPRFRDYIDRLDSFKNKTKEMEKRLGELKEEYKNALKKKEEEQI